MPSESEMDWAYYKHRAKDRWQIILLYFHDNWFDMLQYLAWYVAIFCGGVIVGVWYL